MHTQVFNTPTTTARCSPLERGQGCVINNYIFIKPHDHFSKVLADDGTILLEQLDTRFAQEKHYPSSGIVTHLPDQLWYEPNEVDEALRYKTFLEVQVGDTVINHYLATYNAKKRDIFIDNPDGSRSYGVRYDYLYLRIRDGKVHPLNGCILVHPQFDIIDHSHLITLPLHVAKKKALQRGTVMYTGAPLLAYREWPDIGPDADDIQPGDNVIYPKIDNIPIQNALHQIVNRGMPLIRMQRRDIVAKLSVRSDSTLERG